MGKKKKLQGPYTGKTKAFHRFLEHYWRTEQLLKAGLTGLEESRKPIESLLEKFNAVKPPRGPTPKGYKPNMKAVQAKDLVELSMDDRSAAFLKRTLEFGLDKHKKLRFHYFSILAVSIWGSFETYLSMLFEELYRKRPDMLKTGEQLTFNEALLNKGDLTRYLIDRSLERIGHFTLDEYRKFLKDKLNFQFSQTKRRDLAKFYLIRNIFAHNSGIVRNDIIPKLPTDIRVINHELRLTKSYLGRMNVVTKASITILERHVAKKCFT